jgi:hypothetical protein
LLIITLYFADMILLIYAIDSAMAAITLMPLIYCRHYMILLFSLPLPAPLAWYCYYAIAAIFIIFAIIDITLIISH